LFREFVVSKQRQEDEHDRDMRLAWTIEGLRRQKKLPALKSLLTKRRARTQTVHEQRAMLEILSAQYGIPLRKAKPRG